MWRLWRGWRVRRRCVGRVLSRLLSPEEGVCEPRASALLDLYYYTVRFCRDGGFTREQTSCLFSIMKEIHRTCAETSLGNVDECYQYFKELLLCHAVHRPPFSIAVFTQQQLPHISDYVLNTYFRHFKVYKYVFTPQVCLDLTVSYEEDSESPEQEENGNVTSASGPLPEHTGQLLSQDRLEGGAETRTTSPGGRSEGGAETRTTSPGGRSEGGAETRTTSPGGRSEGGAENRTTSPGGRSEGGAETKTTSPEGRTEGISETRDTSPGGRVETRTRSPGGRSEGGAETKTTSPEGRTEGRLETRDTSGGRAEGRSETRDTSPGGRVETRTSSPGGRAEGRSETRTRSSGGKSGGGVEIRNTGGRKGSGSLK
ncbi:coiled-coil domain-containing protein 189 isoform X2 [Rana temporaria]|uniref:coiled-coil domain-containing protein 189 isoform X2 n=1 Tax=Rana temporaria TaxID=8407 RepID=UPI001AACA020|nr:coiled-coil domain-containing protein 189 isoform X2 [Rana temporaria]